MMTKLSINLNFIIIILVIFMILILIRDYLKTSSTSNKPTESFTELNDYLQSFHQKENRLFPFRYFTDINNNVLPFVAITGFFRGDDAKEKYYEYLSKGIHVFGITAYKSFPNKEMLDESEGLYERTENFDYTGNIKNWLCCFKDKEKYGFTSNNNIIDISESDFYNAELEIITEKKYDFIYICTKDDDSCPLNGWNATNRNFDLALKCFPIMFNDYKFKGLVVGRVNCGLEEKYGDSIEVVEWLDWHTLQERMRQSRMLFVPNIYDASPRVIAECLTKNVPVLMNKNILCGFKYINYETGEFFSDENDFRSTLDKMLNKINKISPQKWWAENYSQELSNKKLRNFLAEAFHGTLNNVDQIKFIL